MSSVIANSSSPEALLVGIECTTDAAPLPQAVLEVSFDEALGSMSTGRSVADTVPLVGVASVVEMMLCAKHDTMLDESLGSMPSDSISTVSLVEVPLVRVAAVVEAMRCAKLDAMLDESLGMMLDELPGASPSDAVATDSLVEVQLAVTLVDWPRVGVGLMRSCQTTSVSWLLPK